MKRIVAFLLCYTLLSSITVQAAVTGYLKIGDIQGESTVSGHEGEIDVFDFSWAINRSIPVDASGAQRTHGETTLGDIKLTKELDKSSPKLMEACARGNFFPEVIFTVQKTVGGTRADYFKITMTDVIVTSVATGGSGDEDRLTETVSLNFTSAEIVYSVFNQDGSLGGIVPGTVQQSVGTP